MNRITLFFVSTLFIGAIYFKLNPAINRFTLQSMNYGYIDKGDSVEFIFGQKKKVKIGLFEADLDKRWDEIKQVYLAGEFNGWSSDNAKYAMKRKEHHLFSIIIAKNSIGKKGATVQFKFVVNGKYWIEPPVEALNKITGADKNTNYYIHL